MPQSQNSRLPEIASSERAFPWLNANGSIAPVAGPSAPPIHVRGPDGAPAHPPATPPRTGMFDDLIPATPPQAVQSVPPSGMPPLPPGFVLDTPPAAHGLPPGYVIDPPARPGMFDDLIPARPPVAMQPDVTVGGNGEPTRITVRPEAQRPPSAMHSLAVGAQGVGAGLRDVALMPFDLAAGAQNLVAGGVNKLFGTEIPMATPASRC